MTKPNIQIRTAQKSDQKAAAEICFLASPVSEDLRHKEIIHLRWSTPYFDLVPEHCFVAAAHEEQEKVVGYILCAPDTAAFETQCCQDWNPKLQAAFKETAPDFPLFERWKQKFLYRFNKPDASQKSQDFFSKYPAHLHINIHPGYQRLGLGHQLMDRLIEHLKASSIKGLHLWVDAANVKGINFYKKYGFQEIRKVGIGKKGSICFGLSFVD